MSSGVKTVEGGVTAPLGFKACGVQVGIKKARPDFAMVYSYQPAVVAGTFTTNRVQAAPVKLCRLRVQHGTAQAIVVNSGNANACTGARGMVDAERMAALAAEALGMEAEDVCVCSTGTIGIPLPMDKISSGIIKAAAALAENGGPQAAAAIMTTDLVSKQAAVCITVDGRDVTIGGMAKGSGMIEPNMATMLAFLTTDAAVSRTALQACLSAAVDRSFNRISVDGDQSTNDTVLMLANGKAGNSELNTGHPEWPVFEQALRQVTRELALAIVKDGEGVTRLVRVTVKGARSVKDAEQACRTIANSLLVKTSWNGGDPNWGRVLAAVGRCGADVDPDRVEVMYDDVRAVADGVAAAGSSLAALEAVLQKDTFTLTVDLHLGDESESVYSCDCSEEYVRINAAYMT